MARQARGGRSEVGGRTGAPASTHVSVGGGNGGSAHLNAERQSASGKAKGVKRPGVKPTEVSHLLQLNIRSDGSVAAVAAAPENSRSAKRQKLEDVVVAASAKHRREKLYEKQKQEGQRRQEKNHSSAEASAAVEATGVAVKGAGDATTSAKAAAIAQASTQAAARKAPNSNWVALKTVAATKRPPLPAHVRKRLMAAAGGGEGSGRRPGVVGDETKLTKVLALDCEMVGVGPNGTESALARVCIVNNAGVVLLDTFVKPNQKVTDYRTWVSGVRPSDIAAGRPNDDVVHQVGEMVRGRILVGHALGNDLRVLQLEDHPRGLLRDTSKYPSLMKELTGGRKASASLKDLAATHLDLSIQSGEHTPVDDARATLYLYHKFHREWEAALKSGQLQPVVSGLGKQKQQRPAGRDHGDRGAGKSRGPSSSSTARGKWKSTGKWKRRGKGGDSDKGIGAHGGAGGVRQADRLRGGKGKAAAKPLWTLAGDPYADL